jgi:hypothetical protein
VGGGIEAIYARRAVVFYVQWSVSDKEMNRVVLWSLRSEKRNVLAKSILQRCGPASLTRLYLKSAGTGRLVNGMYSLITGWDR